MASYERSYGTARAVFSLLEIVRWIVVGVGAIAVFGAVSKALSGSGWDALMSAVWAVSAVIVGLNTIAFVQNFRANVDTAEMTRDLLNIAKAYSRSGKVDLPPASNARAEKTAEPGKKLWLTIPVPDLSEARPDKGEKKLSETFMGVEIYQKHDGHYIKDKWFANLDAAKSFVKKVLDEEAKSKPDDDGGR